MNWAKFQKYQKRQKITSNDVGCVVEHRWPRRECPSQDQQLLEAIARYFVDTLTFDDNVDDDFDSSAISTLVILANVVVLNVVYSNDVLTLR